MANGATHAQYATGGIILVICGSLAAKVLYDVPIDISYTIGGATLAFLIDPDMMDQHQITTRGEHRLFDIFPPLGIFVYIYMWPLARLLPHRHILSHLPPLNTVVRILYCIVPFLMLLWYGFEISIQVDYAQVISFIAGGFILDCIHATLDKWNFHR